MAESHLSTCPKDEAPMYWDDEAWLWRCSDPECEVVVASFEDIVTD